MKVEVFDDKFSLGHLVIGALALHYPYIAPFFILYEIIEFGYKRKKKGRRGETIEHFIGDLIEFLIGIGFGFIVTQLPTNLPFVKDLLRWIGYGI